jgi:hypothetical protein
LLHDFFRHKLPVFRRLPSFKTTSSSTKKTEAINIVQMNARIADPVKKSLLFYDSAHSQPGGKQDFQGTRIAGRDNKIVRLFRSSDIIALVINEFAAIASENAQFQSSLQRVKKNTSS